MEKQKKTPTETFEAAKATSQQVMQAYTDAFMGAATRMDELTKQNLQTIKTLNEQTLTAMQQTATAVLEANATARKAAMDMAKAPF
ncbi:MAG: hypothetical protein R3F62_24625 [Planctomycetota bacterium]